MTYLKPVLAVAAALLMIGGEFDLSIGSTIGAAGVIIAIPVAEYGWPVWAAVLLAFAVAVLIGVVNGVVVNRTRLPSFIVTLASLFILRGLTIGATRLITGRTQVSGLGDAAEADPAGRRVALVAPGAVVLVAGHPGQHLGGRGRRRARDRRRA